MHLFNKIIIFILMSQTNIIFSMEKYLESEENINTCNINLRPLRRFDFSRPNRPYSAISRINTELKLNRENVEDEHETLEQLINIVKDLNNRTLILESENKQLKENLEHSQSYLSIFANYSNIINLLNPDQKLEFCEIMTEYFKLDQNSSNIDHQYNALKRIHFLLSVAKSGNILFIIALRDFALLINNKETNISSNSLLILKNFKLISSEENKPHIETYIQDLNLEEIILEAHAQYLKIVLGIYQNASFNSKGEDNE